MKTLVLSCLAAAVACWAVDVGIFDESRLYSPIYNMATGSYVTINRSIWEERSAVWHQTDLLTESFLSQVSVFYTSQISAQMLTSAEKTALANWVKSGGTLVVTAECG